MDNARKRPPPLPKPRLVPSSGDGATRAVDPRWAWAERAGRRDDPRRDSLGVEAWARLKLLQRAATNFAARLPSAPEWTAFLRAEIIPVYNAVMPEAPMCLECGKRIARKKTARPLCSPECASRFAGRPRKGNATTRAEELGETAKISLGDILSMTANKR